MTETSLFFFFFFDSLLHGWIEKQRICSNLNLLVFTFLKRYLVVLVSQMKKPACRAAIGEPFSTVYRQITGSQLCTAAYEDPCWEAGLCNVPLLQSSSLISMEWPRRNDWKTEMLGSRLPPAGMTCKPGSGNPRWTAPKFGEQKSAKLRGVELLRWGSNSIHEWIKPRFLSCLLEWFYTGCMKI